VQPAIAIIAMAPEIVSSWRIYIALEYGEEHCTGASTRVKQADRREVPAQCHGAGKGTGFHYKRLKWWTSERSTVMNEDRLVGNAKNLSGRMEEGVGRATGDVKAQVEGKAKQAEGAVQDAYGQVKETASDAVEAFRESASGAQDFLRTTIEDRPYTAAAVALGIGYLIGRFSRRDNY
jgi:uncharacterized protein YjbJ (UPF0337 family)